MSTSSRVRRVLRSSILGLVALYVTVGGTALASHPGGANTISSGDVQDNSLTSVDIQNYACQSEPIPACLGGLATEDLQNGAVTGEKLATDSVDSEAVEDESLGRGDLGENSVDFSELRAVSVAAVHIRDNAVGSSEIAHGAVKASEIAFNAVGTSEVVDNSLTGADVDESRLGPVASAIETRQPTRFDGASRIRVSQGDGIKDVLRTSPSSVPAGKYVLLGRLQVHRASDAERGFGWCKMDGDLEQFFTVHDGGSEIGVDDATLSFMGVAAIPENAVVEISCQVGQGAVDIDNAKIVAMPLDRFSKAKG